MQSYAAGTSISLIDQTIGEVFDETVAAHPAKEAVVSRHQGLRVTYHELQERVARTAEGLWGLGIRPGDRVGMWASRLCRMGGLASRHSQDRSRPGQRQPCLPGP